MKCFSSSVSPLLQSWQTLSSGLSPLKRPVSIRIGKTPHLNCARTSVLDSVVKFLHSLLSHTDS